MKSLVAAVTIVLLAGSTACADCGCAVPVAPAPVVVHSFYPVGPVYAYPAPVAYPTTVYYPAPVLYPRAAWYPPVTVRTWVGPLGRVRTVYRYW